MLAALPESGLNLGDINQVSPIAHAVRKDRWELARALADAGADVNVRIGDTEGNSLLHIAAACGKSDAVSWLMAHGADPRAENFRRATPPDVARSAAIMTILKGSPPAS
jgi:ankyrin repeat protein